MGLERPCQKHSRLVRDALHAPDTPCFFPCRASFIRHRRRSRSKPIPSSVGHEREQFSSHRRNERKQPPYGDCFLSFGTSDQKRWDEGPKKMQRTPSRRPPVGGRVGGQVLKKVKILIENSHFGTARKFRFRLTFLSHLYFFSHQNLYLMICFTADSFFQNKDVFPKNQFKLNLLLARFFY